MEWDKMETHPLEGFEDLEEEIVAQAPEDVANLYAWADLPGAKYRDFSANRREQRARMRHRAAEQLRLAELQAQSEAEAAAKQAEMEAAAAHAEADAAASALAAKVKPQKLGVGSHANGNGSDPHEQVKQSSIRTAAQQARKAALEREEAARRAEAAALADSMARREQQEIADAQAAAIRQTARYAEAGLRGRLATSLDSDERIPGWLSDPSPSQWREENRGFDDEEAAEDGAHSDPYLDLDDTIWGEELAGPMALRDPKVTVEQPREGNDGKAFTTVEGAPSKVPEDAHPHAGAADVTGRDERESRAEVVKRISGTEDAVEAEPNADSEITVDVEDPSMFELTAHAMSELFEAEPVIEGAGSEEPRTNIPYPAAPQAASFLNSHFEDSKTTRAASAAGRRDVPGPAWLYPKQHGSSAHRLVNTVQPSPVNVLADGADSLDNSKERIAARWYALRGVFERHDTDRSGEREVAKTKPRQAPIVAVYSIAGGTGKTSLVATLGRALSFLGERVLLADTTSHGLLPFYFGASQLVSGVVRTFSPPAGSTDAPIHLVSYDQARESEEVEGQADIADDLLGNSQRANRVLLDLSLNCSQMVGRLGQFQPTVLIPLIADMNSVISIESVEKLFSTMLDADGRPLQPVYLLNQFDASLPLHLDIREVLKQQLGERLLPFVIRRSPAVGEALAEGMTIVDYDPGSAVAEDYLRVANWLRSVSAPAAVGFRNQRWSEQ